MAEVTPPLFLDVDSVYGADDLGLPYRDIVGEGVMGYEDLRVRQRGAGANMSVDVGPGTAWIMGDNSLQQPLYRCYNDATKNVTVSAAHATNPRIDMVIAEVRDAVFSGAFNDWRLRMVDGTATGGATLDNRTGAAALPSNSILLADVLVPATDTTVGDAEIRDRRAFACLGVVPPTVTRVDQVSLYQHPGLSTVLVNTTHGLHDGFQSAALMFLPQRIVSATRLRWKYVQSGTALTGNYVLAVFDATGRKIVDTGSVAWAGALNTFQVRSETITATTFEAGWYYVFIGMDSGAGAAVYPSVSAIINPATGNVGVSSPNVAFGKTNGSLVVPSQIVTGFTDMHTSTSTVDFIPVPLVSLSVG